MLDEVPPKPERDPLALADASLLKSFAQEAGFDSIHIGSDEFPFSLGNDEDLVFTAATYFSTQKLNEIDAWEKAREGFEEIRGKYVEEGAGGSYSIPDHRFLWLTARRKDSCDSPADN